MDDVIRQVKTDGLATVPGVFSEADCKRYAAALDTLVRSAVKDGTYFGSGSYQVIYNYFIDDPQFLPLIAHPLIDQVMSGLIDKDYVLVSPSARNPCVNPSLPKGEATSGVGWHVDGRVADVATGELYRPSQAFYAIVALEPFKSGNSATHYVPGSHKLYSKPKDRDAKLDYRVMEASAGSVVFFDSALWHRAGEATNVSRWSIFNQYGPWFMKPFFRFADNYTLDDMKALPVEVQKLLHMCSTPPVGPNGRKTTVSKTPVYD